METLEGKYFEKVISELKKVKAEENIQPSQQFRANLRSKIMERASGLETAPVEQFSLEKFVSRWKYVLGLVPTVAVLAIVAMNVANFQLKMKGPEFVPGQYVEQPANKNVLTEQPKSQENPTKQSIKTFSADLALPPADVLDKYLAKQNVETNLMEISINNGEVNLTAVTPENGKLDFSGNVSNLKITTPKLTESKVEITPVVTNDTPSERTFSAVPVQVFSNPQTNSTENFGTQSNSNNLPTVPVEQGGRVEQSMKLNTANTVVPAADQNVTTLDQTQNKQVVSPNVQTNSVINSSGTVVNNPVTDSVPTAVNSVPANTQQVMDLTQSQVVQTPTQPQTKQTMNLDSAVLNNVNSTSGSDTLRQNFNLDAIASEIRSNINQSQSIDPAKIQYSGNDFDLIKKLLNQEFQVPGTADYRFTVARLDSGTLKIEYYEAGQIRKLVFMKLIDGEYRNVTEINF